MSVLVTGGAGYIGSHMVWELIDAGEEVVVIDNFSTGFDWAICEKAKVYSGNIGDVDLLNSIFRKENIDAIIHFAGSIIVPESVSDPLLYYRNNTANSRTLMDAAVKHNIRHFIFSSTAAIYGAPGSKPVDEQAPVDPQSPYGRSKLMSEMMLADTALAHDFKYGVLRYFNVAGADVKGRTGQSTKGATHLIKIACEAALGQREEMHVYGVDYDTPDGTGVRDYIHVSDLAAAHYKTLQHLRAGGESVTLNCGYGRGFSVLEVIETVKEVANSDFKVCFSPRRDGDIASVIANSDKAKELLNWQPQWDDLSKIVSDALKWQKKLSQRNTL